MRFWHKKDWPSWRERERKIKMMGRPKRPSKKRRK